LAIRENPDPLIGDWSHGSDWPGYRVRRRPVGWTTNGCMPKLTPE